MKYMGGKQRLLQLGLGHVLLDACSGKDRFVDLFSGSAAVSHYVASRSPIVVWANDLQRYSAVLARAVIERTHTMDAAYLRWHRKLAEEDVSRIGCSALGVNAQSEKSVRDARQLCAAEHRGFFWNHYGGYFYSPSQALLLDALYARLPPPGAERDLALAALLHAASRCAAAPGHTAQPWRPVHHLLPHLQEAWRRDPGRIFLEAGLSLGRQSALRKGRTTVNDAVSAAKNVNERDVVFLDIPYSAAHYSRFYHVLEAAAIGGYASVGGAGRMPPHAQRAQSAFSLRTRASAALSNLLQLLASRESTVVATFPEAECSNGISGASFKAAANRFFRVNVTKVPLSHSTLGGRTRDRASRRLLHELVLVLEPR